MPSYHASNERSEACAITSRMLSTVVTLLAEMPEPELRAMQSRLESERVRIEAERARVDVELTQITEALERKMRRAAPKPSRSPKRPTRPGATQKLILDAVARLHQPVSPAEIIADMEAHGASGNRGTIHNAIGRLVKIGELDKLDVGQYQLASRNGSLGESHAGPSENGVTEPLSTAAGPQEALHE